MNRKAFAPELANRYYFNVNETSALGGRKKLQNRFFKEDKKRVTDWLRGQDAYTLHRPARTKFQRRPTIVAGPGVQVQADLMDVRSHSKDNDGVAYLLNIVDVFSKKAWSLPIKNKSAQSVTDAMRKSGAVKGLRYVQTDKGKEFFNASVKEYLKSQKVKLFSSENETIKASIVERFNRTLRNKIHRMLTARRGRRFIDALPALVDAYNNTVHSSTDYAPNDVTRNNAADVAFNLYERRGARAKRYPPKFSPGDYVRISSARTTFERGYTPNWTVEIFVINKVLSREQPVVYELEDLAGETLLGRFYEPELQLVKKPEFFRIDKVLRRRGRGDNREMFVKWHGYPESFNSWVRAADFE